MRESYRRLVGRVLLLCALAGFVFWCFAAPVQAQVHVTISGGSPDQGDCPPEGMPGCGDPINIATGNAYLKVTDYTTAGPNALSFTRDYNSQGSFVGLVGPKWTTNFDRALSSSGAHMTGYRPDGKVLLFSRIGYSNRWVAESDIDMTLTQSGTTWTMTDWNDNVETYALSGCGLVSIQTRNGYTQTINYNFSCQITSVTDSYGRTLSFGGFGFCGLSSITTPDGLVVSYGYSAATCALTSVTYSTSPATSQSYLYQNSALPFALTGIIDEDGNLFTTWAYDSYGRATSTQSAGGANLTQIAFNSDGSRTVTNALGEQEVYVFDTSSYPVPKIVEIDRLATATTTAAARTFTWDSNGYLASQTDWNGNLTTYVNNAQGAPIQITEAAGTPQQRTTSISYLANFTLPSQIVAPGLTTSLTYDGNGNLLTRTQGDTTGSSGQTRSWTSLWGANFLPTSVTDPRGNTTQFGWDSSGALVSLTNALGQVTRITKHTGGGRPLTIVDPNGVVTNLTYDPRQRLLSRTVNTGAGALTTAFAYDAAGNLIQTTLPDGAALANTYDAAHRLVAIADLLSQQILYTLDALGDRTQTLILDSGGSTTREHSASYDALGRLLQDVGGAGQTTSYVYDANGNRTAITDPLGRVTTQAFDALNRRVRITDPAGGVTLITYDPQDRPVTVTDPNGHATNSTYDGFGDLIQQVSPDSGATSFNYDLAGNRVQRIDAAGDVTNWSYDAINRLTAATYPADAAENVSYFYDGASAGFGIGHLTEVVDNGGGAGTLERTYDERGNVLSETRIRGGVTLATDYAYDAASRVVGVTYPSGAAASYTRDAMGRITALLVQPLSLPAVPVVSSVAYLPFGPASGLIYGNGMGETRAFDLDYRLTGQSDAGKTLSRNQSYSYDADDNVVALGDNAFGNQSFAYDALNRVTGAVGSYGNLQYAYDPVGNLVSLSSGAATQNLSYAAGSNRLLAISGSVLRQFNYSATGNINSDQQSGQTISLAYNQGNRLSAVTVQPNSGPAANYRYLYDGFGQRLAKSLTGTGGFLTVYQYDLRSRLLEETDLSSGASKPLTDYLYLGNRPVASLSPAGGNLFFLHGDRLETPQAATTQLQGVAWAAAYNPLGVIKPLVSSITQNLRFSGQYADQETAYYHNGFRDYDPTVGRYIESDPIGLVGGLDTYAYAADNPVARGDRLGLNPGNSNPPASFSLDTVTFFADLGFGELSSTYIPSNGNVYSGGGATSTPALSCGIRFGHVEPLPGQTKEDVVAGGSVGGGLSGNFGSLGGVPVSVGPSVSGNSSGTTTEIGVTLGGSLPGLFPGKSNASGSITYNELQGNLKDLLPPNCDCQEQTSGDDGQPSGGNNGVPLGDGLYGNPLIFDTPSVFGGP